MLAHRLGPGCPGQDADRAELLARIPASRLPAHPLILTDASTRLTMAMGAWTAALALPGYSGGMPGFFNVVYLHEAFGATYCKLRLILPGARRRAVIAAAGHRRSFRARRVAMAWPRSPTTLAQCRPECSTRSLVPCRSPCCS
jgi:hypothetical protein